VHIRGNHLVFGLDDVVVEVIDRGCGRALVYAKDVIHSLVRRKKLRLSIDPIFSWLKAVEDVDSTTLVVTNAAGGRRRISLATGKVMKQG
jgi:hypothetical protein